MLQPLVLAGLPQTSRTLEPGNQARLYTVTMLTVNMQSFLIDDKSMGLHSHFRAQTISSTCSECFYNV